MTSAKPSFTIGVEEEYLLVDRATRDVVSEPPTEIVQQCRAHEDNRSIEPELLRSQIEVNTRVCNTVSELRDNLAHLRRVVVQASEHHGMAPVAASTHPFARWQLQHHTPKQRYDKLTRNMRSLAKRVLVCGMHVHVGIEDDELRVNLMNQLSHFLPLLLALSTSSPFWEGLDSGLKSYRLPVFDGFPRTGLPERYANYAEYRSHVESLQRVGVIEDATMIWWDLRISDRYPTLEMRITDTCTDINDAIAITALTQCLLHYLHRLRNQHMHWHDYHRFLVDQNRWRAIRYGYDEGLIDFAHAKIISVSDILHDLVTMLGEDARELDCLADLERVLEIPKRGTSAHQQLETYHQALASGHNQQQALHTVVDFLISKTAAGL
jgi:carboxylate-amine ligase